MISVRYAKEDRKRDRKRRRVVLQIGPIRLHLDQKEISFIHRELGKRKVKST
jgi:hypothetical protein